MDLRQLEIIRAIADRESLRQHGDKLPRLAVPSAGRLLLEDNWAKPCSTDRRQWASPAGDACSIETRVFRTCRKRSAINDTQETLRGTIRLVGGETVCLYCSACSRSAADSTRPDEVTVGTPERSGGAAPGAPGHGLVTLPVEASD